MNNKYVTIIMIGLSSTMGIVGMMASPLKGSDVLKNRNPSPFNPNQCKNQSPVLMVGKKAILNFSHIAQNPSSPFSLADYEGTQNLYKEESEELSNANPDQEKVALTDSELVFKLLTMGMVKDQGETIFCVSDDESDAVERKLEAEKTTAKKPVPAEKVNFQKKKRIKIVRDADMMFDMEIDVYEEVEE